MGRLVALLVGCILFCNAVLAQKRESFSPGKVIPKVICAGNPQQSYALYLPSTYSTTKRWPIIYAFDPAARGQVAVEAIREAAEKYGYIVAGSNNSRNGADKLSTEAAKAMWDDTQQRFPIDGRRRYFAGMSGGARVAAALALSCRGCVAGVIANAAGFPTGLRPARGLMFAYFAALGNADFNFPEFVDLRRQLEEARAQYRIRMFDGEHGWAPPEIWLAALDWMDLEAMRAGTLERDTARIQQSYDASVQRANQLLSENETLEASREAKFATRDFAGLTDTSAAEKMVAELGRDKRVKAGEKEEASLAADQNRLAAEPAAQIQAVAAGNLPADEFIRLRNTLAMLLRETKNAHGNSDVHLLVRRRALGGLVIQAYSSALLKLEQKDYDAALSLFDLIVAGSENPGWAHYYCARAYAGKGDKKRMFGELKLASAAGFHDVSALNAPEFRDLENDSNFQEIMRDWSGNAKP